MKKFLDEPEKPLKPNKPVLYQKEPRKIVPNIVRKEIKNEISVEQFLEMLPSHISKNNILICVNNVTSYNCEYGCSAEECEFEMCIEYIDGERENLSYAKELKDYTLSKKAYELSLERYKKKYAEYKQNLKIYNEKMKIYNVKRKQELMKFYKESLEALEKADGIK